jgi:sugar/nucleoside kinase (ribokinase family)
MKEDEAVTDGSSFILHPSSFIVSSTPMKLPVSAPPPDSRPFDAVALGLNAVDHLVVVPRFPAFASKIELISHQVLPGGQCATAMVALSRLGLRTRYVGRVGSDDTGRLQLASLDAEGVERSECRVVQGASSQLAFILVDEGTGERTVIWSRDPRIAVHPDEIDEALVCSGRALHLDGHNIEAEIRAARWARAAGIPVTIDVDFDYGGEELYPLVDYLITSADFPARVTGIAEERAALAALRDRFACPLVGMTLGARGALVLCDGVYVESPGFRVDVRDTTGAGDAFHAGFLFGLLEGQGLEECLRTANAVAALNSRVIGARGGLPTRPELEAFLATH